MSTAPHIKSKLHRDYVPAGEDTFLRFKRRHEKRTRAERDRQKQTDDATKRFRDLTRAHSERRA